MARVAALIAALLGCSGPADGGATTVSPDGLEQAAITIYRDGDRRFKLGEETVYRPDGNNRTMKSVSFAPPIALVVETARLPLSPGKQTVSLPRVPAQAAPSSLWLQSLTATGGVRLDSVEPRQAGYGRVLGRRVRIEVGDQTVVGTAIALVEGSVSVRTDDGKLWLISTSATSVASEGEDKERPLVTLEVDRAGDHLLEVGYSTSAIDWTFDYHLELAESEPAEEVDVELAGLLSINNGTDTDFSGAKLTVFSGTLSSTERHPIALWRGTATVAAHGSMSVPVEPPAVRAQIGYEYRPTFRSEAGDRADPLWGLSATDEVSKSLWLTPKDGETLVAGKISARMGGALFESVLRERVTGPNTASVRLGAGKRLRGRRSQQATRRSRDGELFTESIEISIENRNKESRVIKVIEALKRSSRFELVKSKPKGKVHGDELHFEIEVEGGETKKVRYTVRYTM